MASSEKISTKPSTQSPPQRGMSSGAGWLDGMLGGGEIQKRVDENYPSWEEVSGPKGAAKPGAKPAQDRSVLPPYRIYISSPLQGNFIYLTMVVLALALGIYLPSYAPVLVYGAIGFVLMTSLFVVFRDALFLHLEGQRLETDANMINKHTKGPKNDPGEGPYGFMQNRGSPAQSGKVFRSLLLQIHYQNILRTFEQGNRRTWVDQDASIADLHTLLTQRGMKLVWTMIEVLPQLGLLGTLIGLMRMFTAFQPETVNVGIMLAGLGTALGTTVVANVLVLVLRPLYMRNERTMNEVLSTIQTLMATFILPTQETVLERTLLAGFGRSGFPQSSTQLASASSGGINEARLVEALSELSGKLGRYTDVQQQVDSGAMAEQTAEIAEQVRDTLRLFAESVDRDQMAAQRLAFQQLTMAIQGLERNLNRIPSGSVKEAKPPSERMERDLTQLRVLTHDTLLLLEQIAGRLSPDGKGGGRLLSTDPKLRAQVFSGAELPASKPEQKEPEADSGEGSGPVRLFKGPA